MRTFALLLLMLNSLVGVSQNCTYTLKGKVVDFHDGSPLAGATIIVAGTEMAYQTDIDGNFQIDALCDQTYFLQVSHPFCSTKGYTIKVNGDMQRTLRLEHHLEELNEVIVTGKVFSDKSKTLLESQISGSILEGFSGGSLGDALNSLSGVSSLNTGNTVVKPMINGLHSSRVLMINQGAIMEDQEWGAEHAPNIDINTAGNITLLKGAGALQYGGDAVGGIIISESPKVPTRDTLYGKTLLTTATNGRGGAISTHLTKGFESGWYAAVQATLKRLGDFEAPDYVLSNTGVYERNFSARFGLNRYTYGFEGYYSMFRSDIGILRASHLGGAEDQVTAINSGQPLIIEDFTYDLGAPRQEVTHHLMRLSAFKRYEKLGKLSFHYDFQMNDRFEFDVRRGENNDRASIDLNLQTHTVKLDLDSDISESIGLKSGIMARYQKNFANPETGVRRLIPDYDRFDLGVYAIADYRLSEKAQLEFGGRFDYTHMDVLKFYRTSFWEARGYDVLFPEIVVEDFGNQILTNPKLNFYNGSATFGATYSFNDDLTLFGNYSLASRIPNPSELFSEGLHHSASRIELGDLRFGSEIGHKFSATLRNEGEQFRFSVSPYLNLINNFIVMEPTDVQQTIRGNFQVWEYRQTDARLIGLDLDASFDISDNFEFVHQFSWVKGKDTTRDDALINMPPVNTTNELLYKNESWNNLRLSLQSQYVFEQNEFPDNNFEVFVPETETFELVDVSTPPDAYHLLNFNGSMDVQFNKRSTLTIGLSVSNIFNTSYRNYLNRLRYYADDLGRNFLLNLKINY